MRSGGRIPEPDKEVQGRIQLRPKRSTSLHCHERVCEPPVTAHIRFGAALQACLGQLCCVRCPWTTGRLEAVTAMPRSREEFGPANPKSRPAVTIASNGESSVMKSDQHVPNVRAPRDNAPATLRLLDLGFTKSCR